MPTRPLRSSTADAPATAAAPVHDRCTAYARAVVSGKILAGPWVRASCQRHLNDLRDGPKRGLRWSVEHAHRAWRYFEEILKLNGGQFEGKPFILLDWQAFIVGSLFGWLKADGYRRFSLAYIETAKGSGKSPLAAGIGLYMMSADRENRAEIYAAARTKDQAMVLFRDAVAMVKQSPLLADRLETSGGAGREWNIAYTKTGSWFRPISSEDGKSGPRPHCALLDEIHEHPDDSIIEMMQAGNKFRQQPLNFMITNSGASRTSVCWRYHEYAIKIATGQMQEDSFFSYICALDEGEDPFKDEKCWGKANPSLGITFGEDYLRKQVDRARGLPSKEGIVRRLHFCQWTDAVSDWIGVDLWKACEQDFNPEENRNLQCWLALDLASKRDHVSLTAIWERDPGQYDACNWYWTPEETLEERARTDSVPYEEWVKAQHMFAVEGRMVDKRHVALFVQQFCARHKVRALAFDQAQIDDFLQACKDIGMEAWIWSGDELEQEDGLMLVRHGQGFMGFNSKSMLWMPRSIGLLEEKIVNSAIRIKPNPVLRWNSASAVLESDPTGNRKWNKRKSTGRIDGIVTLSMAVGAADAKVGPLIFADDFEVTVWD